jgi:uncharacterized protein YndB with AHSA1/START domain
MFKKIAIVLVVLIAGVLIYAATQPDAFRVQRTASIKAPPEKIFAILDDFHRSESWSPYEKKDPAMKRTFSGATSGKGSVYEWDGNKDIGKGRMEITESSPPSRLTMTLDFIKPFEAHNIVDFTLEPRGDSTEVTWAIHGPMPYLSKVMCVFFSMDRMVGGDFEAGLAALKTVAESPPAS